TLSRHFCSSICPSPPRSPLFPYTTLFRSREPRGDGGTIREHGDRRVAHGGDGRGELLEEPRELELHPEGPQLRPVGLDAAGGLRSEEHTSELQSLRHLVCRLLLEKKKKKT